MASSSTITVAEESANTPLGLTAPTDVDGNPLTITVTGLPAVGTITLADGTPVTNGQVLTAAQLAGLQFDAPADLLASTSTSFTYSVSDGTATVNAGTTISVTPVNDAPVASSSTITVAEESANTPLGLTAPTDVDGNPLTITVTGLPTVGTITLADGTPVTNGQVLTAAQLAGLQFDAPADLLASTIDQLHLHRLRRHGHRQRRHDDQRHAGQRCAGRVQLDDHRRRRVGQHAAGL